MKPIHTTIYKLKGKSSEELRKWRIEYNETFLHFPGGLLDWFAFGLLVGILFIPIIVITVKFRLDIFTNKYLFALIFITIMCLVYYIVYFRSKEWLTDEINKVSENFYT